MLEGITVLSKEPILMQSKIGIMFAITCMAIAVTLFCVSLYQEGYNFMIFSICLFFGGIIIGSLFTEDTGLYEYKCTISEDVSLQDFEERYEIVRHDGDLWVIEDKETE